MSDAWNPQLRFYGLPSRLRWIQKTAPADPSLLRWYPTWQLLDPLAVLDLTSPWEQAWVTRWFSQNRVEGAVVELGTWLGAITRAMARAGQTQIDVYDTFVFTDVEQRIADMPLRGRFHDGDCFLDLYLRRAATNPHVHKGDVLHQSWDGGPIGFLFVDLAKTWEVWRHIRASFLPHLRLGAIVIQQDWAHACTPWLHLWHHRWRDHFEVLGHIIHSSSVVFRLTRALPDEARAADSLSDYTSAEVDAAFAWAAGLVRPNKRPNIAGARVVLHAYHGNLDQAIDAVLAGALEVPVVEEFASFAIPELARRIAAAESTPRNTPRPAGP